MGTFTFCLMWTELASGKMGSQDSQGSKGNRSYPLFLVSKKSERRG